MYTIKQHGGSLYYSTPDGEIFRIDPDHPDSADLICSRKSHPIRSLAFSPDGNFFASSYRSGVYRISGDTLLPVKNFSRPAWSMKLDPQGNIWLASMYGVFRQNGDSLLQFTNLSDANDLDFFDKSLVVAHRKGISFYDIHSGECLRWICRDTICWMVHAFDTLLVGGGVRFCAFINGNIHISVNLGNRHNIPWDCAMNGNGDIFLATQMGLYRIRQGETRAECIGYRGKCVKSVLIDTKKRLWAGKYY